MENTGFDVLDMTIYDWISMFSLGSKARIYPLSYEMQSRPILLKKTNIGFTNLFDTEDIKKVLMLKRRFGTNKYVYSRELLSSMLGIPEYQINIGLINTGLINEIKGYNGDYIVPSVSFKDIIKEINKPGWKDDMTFVEYKPPAASVLLSLIPPEAEPDTKIRAASMPPATPHVGDFEWSDLRDEPEPELIEAAELNAELEAELEAAELEAAELKAAELKAAELKAAEPDPEPDPDPDPEPEPEPELEPADPELAPESEQISDNITKTSSTAYRSVLENIDKDIKYNKEEIEKLTKEKVELKINNRIALTDMNLKIAELIDERDKVSDIAVKKIQETTDSIYEFTCHVNSLNMVKGATLELLKDNKS